MNVHHTLKVALMAGLFAAQTAIAGSAISPVPISSGDRCIRCNRLLSDRWVAAEAVGDRSLVAKFRTVRCMLAYLTETNAPFTQVFVTDNQTGKLVDVDKAVFVPVSIDIHTGIANYGIGETDYVAFRSPAAAERFATNHGVTTMSWAAVRYYASFLPVIESETR